MKRLWLVKIGGSLERAPALRSWIEASGRFGLGRVIVVPGGGSFANEVRSAQVHWGFSDSAAHHMALLAMEQFGLLLADMEPRLKAARSDTEIRNALEAQHVPVWLPSAMVLADPALPQSWSLSSDSLAAWLAGQINASHLVMVKSVNVDGPEVSLAQLQASGVVDGDFSRMIRDKAFATWIAARNDYRSFADALQKEAGIGVRVLADRSVLK
jgi:aspartokinase-like uncharacterized kinase